MIRIAFATNKGGLDDFLADRFGRAPIFTIIDIDEKTGEIKTVKIIENPGSKTGSRACVRAVRTLIDEKVHITVGPRPGPNAYTALQQAGIKIYTITGVSVREALEKLLKELISS